MGSDRAKSKTTLTSGGHRSTSLGSHRLGGAQKGEIQGFPDHVNHLVSHTGEKSVSPSHAGVGEGLEGVVPSPCIAYGLVTSS